MLEIKNLVHTFGGLKAISDFSVTLPEQGIYGLIGPNGAGKTTVFNIVSGFYRPRKGSISLSGINLIGLKPHRITHQGIARTFQNIRLWPGLTVMENLGLAQHSQLEYGFFKTLFRPPSFKKSERTVEAWSRALIEKFHLQSYAEIRTKQLPYGIQRKVEMARALATRPKLLLLDEPAAGLNNRDVDDLIELIARIADEFKLTVWMVEHQMKVVMTLCKRIQVIDFGATIAEGTPQEIQQHPEVIKAYLGGIGTDASRN